MRHLKKTLLKLVQYFWCPLIFVKNVLDSFSMWDHASSSLI